MFRNNLDLFDPYKWKESGKWEGEDIFASTLISVSVSALIPLVFFFSFGDLMLIVGAVLAVLTAVTWNGLILNHRYYGVDKGKVSLIRAIDNLPPALKARFGSDYRERIIQTYDTNALRSEVDRLTARQKQIAELDARLSHSIDDIVQTAREVNNELNSDISIKREVLGS